jgi:PIN domain nuclease of toxin-antitoxin system
MRLLLDTNIVIRLRQERHRMDDKTRRLIENAAALYVSAASIWEIAIKVSSRKLALDIDALEDGLREASVEPLPITWAHALRARDIAASHPDPFDRLLLAQAISEPLHLLTSDHRLTQYAGDVVIAVRAVGQPGSQH